MKIVLDCMGNDHGPAVVVKGAVEALRIESDLEVIFVGEESIIQNTLNELSWKERVQVISAPNMISNHESPVKAIRTKKDASIVKAMEIVKEKEADALISSGSTGALLAGALFIVGRIEGIQRAALTTIYPTKKSPVLLLDIGANVDCKAEYLEQFAVMGSIYANKILKREKPRVALANIGAENEKGNALVKEAYTRLAKLQNIHFVGNIEARDLMEGEVDVIVCDGFVGNIILKTTEGTALTIFGLLKEVLTAKPLYKIAAAILKKPLKKFKKAFDYSEYGAAPLLGVKAPIFKAHGSSDMLAIQNAVLRANEYLKQDIISTIKNEIESLKKGE